MRNEKLKNVELREETVDQYLERTGSSLGRLAYDCGLSDIIKGRDSKRRTVHLRKQGGWFVVTVGDLVYMTRELPNG